MAEGTAPQAPGAALSLALSVTGKGVGSTLLALSSLSCKVARGKSGTSYQLLPSWVGGWRARREDGETEAGVSRMQMERVGALEDCG